MGKKTLFFYLLLVYGCMGLWAAGSKENESRTAAEPSGFTDSVNISEKKPGKYNFYFEAKDKAGNASLAGPDNIWVDPESDLPRTTVINPMPDMRVQGNLNIVGIAVDDDGVDHVELTVTRGKDGKGEELVRVRAIGAEYWSYFLDTTNPEIWTDGVYTITAWAVDINGLSGISENFRLKAHKKHLVHWNLDRKKPETAVTSHEIGALVSGKIRLKGNVFDGNGIKSFSYSIDGGERFLPIKVGLDKKTGLYNWDVDINTKVFEDGPSLIWFKATDGQGSMGTAAHLLYANNTGPDVKIVYPQADTVVNGIFTVAGYASHPVGLRSVTWKADKATGELEMITGNPWWSTEIDLRNVKTSSIEIEIRAVDVSGNTTIKKQKYKVDQNANLPTITLQEPAAGAVVNDDGSLVVKGFVKDDDGAAAVFYSLDGGPETEIPCSGYFQFIVPEIAEGVHTFDIWAKDITGVTGPKVQVKNIAAGGPLPEPRIASFSQGTGKTAVVSEFYTGMTITPQPKVRMTLELEIKASTLNSSSVTFGELPPVTVRPSAGKDGIFRASVNVPENLGNGFTQVQLRATDRLGREVVYDEYIFVSSPEYSSYSSNWFRWVRQNLTPEGHILIESNFEILLGLGNEPMNRAEVTGTGADKVFVSVDENRRVRLQAREEGVFGPLTLTLENLNYQTYYSDPFYVYADFTGPSITMQETPQGWLQTSVPVKFNVWGTIQISAVEYSIDMGSTWQNILSEQEYSAIRSRYAFDVSKVLDISGIEDGSVNLMVRAVNEAGRTVTSNFTVFKDTQSPEAQLIVPIADERVNGTIMLGFAVQESGKLKSVRYHRPAGSGTEINTEVFNPAGWDKDYSVIFFNVMTDSVNMPLDENMRFTFEDEAGNSSEVAYWPFIIDAEMDIPVVHVVLPLENEVITTDFIVSGVMFDDDAIKQIYYKLDEGEEQILVAENGFSIPIPLAILTDNEHSVTVTAEDIYGVKSEPVTRGFRVSLKEPRAEVTFPLFDTVMRDVIQIKGTSFDENGIEGLQVSVDNGNTFNTVYGTTEWGYFFQSKILKDGPHVVFIRVWDNYGVQATYSSMINVDNTPPEITLDSPGDGSYSTGTVSIMGRTLDPNLENVTIELRSLEGARIADELRKRTLENNTLLKETLNLSNQQDGLFNVEIVATDSAGNITRVSRNVELARETMKNYVEVFYPLENENMQGVFNLYGFAGGTDPAGTVTARINGIDQIISEVEDSGYFRFSLDSSQLYAGENKVVIHSNFGKSEIVESQARTIVYKPDGPWVTIDSMNMGGFAFERPYLFGRAGYALSDEDREILADRRASKELRADVQAKTLKNTEISFDNGKTFLSTSGSLSRKVDYRYRLETGDMVEGMHYILVRANMKNGDTAVTKILVQVDKTKPVIRLITPESGSRYNEEIAYSASATDDVELAGLTYHIRKGDKSAYEIPGFIQGLYFEGIIPPLIRQFFNEMPVMPFGGGATYTDFGMGLSFFDDNVKIQLQYGFLTQDLYEALGGIGPLRYGGHVLGIKLLASVYALPFGSFAGPDWEWLSATFAVGANFSLFNVGNQLNEKFSTPDQPVYYTQSGEQTWMSALLLQIEFPKVTIPKWKYLRTFSLFTEGQLWFVPTDVDAKKNNIETVIPHVIVGFRLYVF